MPLGGFRPAQQLGGALSQARCSQLSVQLSVLSLIGCYTSFEMVPKLKSHAQEGNSNPVRIYFIKAKTALMKNGVEPLPAVSLTGTGTLVCIPTFVHKSQNKRSYCPFLTSHTLVTLSEPGVTFTEPSSHIRKKLKFYHASW